MFEGPMRTKSELNDPSIGYNNFHSVSHIRQMAIPVSRGCCKCCRSSSRKCAF